MNKIDSSQFFRVDYVDQASYDNLRKIASAIDGLKNSNRKVIHTVLDKNIKELVKVSQLSAKCAEYTDYLHGSLDSVVVTLGSEYVGTNQIPLLQKKGNFGTRSIPEASASRYIFAKANPLLDSIFLRNDRDVLIQQSFEGELIEPKFFVPVLPMLLVNGSKGVSSGFAQNIAPRSVRDLIQILKQRLTGDIQDFGVADNLKPYWEGFNGYVTENPEGPNKYFIDGSFSWSSKGSNHFLHITELPIDGRPRQFVELLEKLKEDKKIQNFEDRCDGDAFDFVVKMKSKISDVEVLKMFKLRSSLTENLTSLNESNKIIEYSRVSVILEDYYRVKLDFQARRKALEIQRMEEQLYKMMNQIKFILEILKGTIDLRKLSGTDLIGYLEASGYRSFGGYDYLTNIRVGKMTSDQVERWKQELRDLNEELKALRSARPEDLWLKDLINLEEKL